MDVYTFLKNLVDQRTNQPKILCSCFKINPSRDNRYLEVPKAITIQGYSGNFENKLYTFKMSFTYTDLESLRNVAELISRDPCFDPQKWEQPSGEITHIQENLFVNTSFSIEEIKIYL